jgi:hypothetical protein
MKGFRCCIVFYLFLSFLAELKLACDESELSPMQLTFDFNETNNRLDNINGSKLDEFICRLDGQRRVV